MFRCKLIFFSCYICNSIDEFIRNLSGYDVEEHISIIYFVWLGKLVNLLRLYPANEKPLEERYWKLLLRKNLLFSDLTENCLLSLINHPYSYWPDFVFLYDTISESTDNHKEKTSQFN